MTARKPTLDDYTSGVADVALEVSGTVHQMQGLVALVGDPIPVLLTDEGAQDVASIRELINPLQRKVLVERLRWWADALDDNDPREDTLTEDHPRPAARAVVRTVGDLTGAHYGSEVAVIFEERTYTGTLALLDWDPVPAGPLPTVHVVLEDQAGHPLSCLFPPTAPCEVVESKRGDH